MTKLIVFLLVSILIIGTSIIKSAKLLYNDLLIEQITGEYISIYENLHNTTNKNIINMNILRSITI